MDLVGRRVGNYQLVRLLGEGGMGIVYEAVHPVLGRRAAIKILKLGVGTPVATRVVERFFNEARLVASLGHENIVEAFDFGEVQLDEVTSYYVAMELLEGESLRQRLRRGALALRDLLALGRQAAAALGAAHGRGVVHRDVKPDNLFLARKPDGREVLKVLDFGIAKLVGDATPMPGLQAGFTGSGLLLGTPGFMSPEQCAGRPLDARADVYSLGLVLYEAATGQRAFVRETEAEVMAAQVRDAPPAPTTLRPELPAAVEAVILRALAKKPELRFASMAELDAALARLESEAAPAPSRAELDGLLEACAATRALAAPQAAPASGRTLPLYAPAGVDAETHTVGRPDGVPPGGLNDAPTAVRPAAAATVREVAAAPRRSAAPMVVFGVLAVVGGIAAALVVPRLLGRPAPAPVRLVLADAGLPPVAVAPAPEASPGPGPASVAAPAGRLSRPIAAGAVDPSVAKHPPEAKGLERAAEKSPEKAGEKSPEKAAEKNPEKAPEPRGRAHLSVHVVPWAKVTIDGAAVGETPIERDLAPGAHTVVLANDGLGKAERIPLRLAAGEKKTITRRWKAAE